MTPFYESEDGIIIFNDDCLAVLPLLPDLMRWLVRLITPTGGTVLDPFAGSGSTGKACALEGVKCIQIEAELEYCEIAARRCRIAQRSLFHG